MRVETCTTSVGRRFILALAVGGAIVFGSAMTVHGQPCEVDQEQTNIPGMMALFGQNDLAQSFSPSKSQTCGASIHTTPGFGTLGDVTIELWDRLPDDGGHLLRSETVAGVGPGEWVTVSWPVLGIDPTRQYFVVATCTDPTMAWSGDMTDPYPGGIAYANAGYDPFPGADYSFKTYADPCEVDQAMTTSIVCGSPFKFSELAQSFTPMKGSISGAGAFMFSGSGGTGDVTIELWDNLPSQGGTLLASGAQTGVGDNDSIRVEWKPVSVIPGATYFLVFTGTDWTQCLGGACGDMYPNGEAWITGNIFPDCDWAFETYSCELDCMAGNVNQAAEVVLTVNGQDSSDGAWIQVPSGGPINGTIVRPSAGGNGKFLIHANWGAPTSDTVVDLPGRIGEACFDLLIVSGGGTATPAAIWNNIGKVDKVGSSTYFDGTSIPDPARAPVDFLSLPAGDTTNLPVGTVFTLQGVIIDPNTGSNKSVSLTNTVIVSVK